MKICDGPLLFLESTYVQKHAYTAFRWFVRIPAFCSSDGFRDPSCIRRTFREVLLGDAFSLTQAQAREKAAEYAEYAAQRQRLPPSDAGDISVLADGGGMLHSLPNLRSSPWPDPLGDDEVAQLSCRCKFSEIRRIGRSLCVRVDRRPSSIQRTYCFMRRDGGAGYMAIGSTSLISAGTAYDLAGRLEKASARGPAACRKIIGDFRKALSLPPPQSAPEPERPRPPMVFIDAGAIRELFKNELGKLPCAAGGKDSGGITLGGAYELWKAEWGPTVCERHRESCTRGFEKAMGCFFEAPLEELVDKRILVQSIMKLRVADPNFGNRTRSTLGMILDFAVAGGFITSNPIRSLPRFKQPSSGGHRRALDPYNLKNEIRRLFGSVIIGFPLFWRSAFELLFLTLLRAGEMLSLSWDDLAGDGGKSATGRRMIVRNTKTLNEFSIPVSGYMLKLLELRKKDCGKSPWVFPKKTDPADHCRQVTLLSRRLRQAGCGWFDPHGARSAGADFFAAHPDKVSYEAGMACLQHAYASACHLRYER
ncbi:MAG: tyrosine-type recombinase/integrase, partial [Succinivibrio sp.]